MDDPFLIYVIFNRLEGLAWWIVAAALPFVVKPKTPRQKWAIALASLGFVLFGITDFLEAPLRGQLPPWLWLFKIGCAAWILSSRFFYIGWNRFRLTDRYFLFGLACLTATLGVIWLQHVLYGPGGLAE